MKNILFDGIQIFPRNFLYLLILYVNASLWYYVFYTQIFTLKLNGLGIFLEVAIIKLCFNLSIAVSLFLGGLIVDRIKKLKVVFSWGIVMPLCTIILDLIDNVFLIIFIIFLLGSISGLALLAYLSYFTNQTVSEERGRIAGIMVTGSLLITVIVMSLLGNLGILEATGFYVFIGISTSMVALLSPRESKTRPTKLSLSIYKDHTFLMYVITWLIISIVNGISAPILSLHFSRIFPEITPHALLIQFILAITGALISGILADWRGRKFFSIIGLTLMGVSSALFGIMENPITVLVYMGVSGFTWGIFLVIYTLVVWGDISKGGIYGPYYGVGLGLFYLFRGLWIPQLLLQIPIPFISLISCLLLFLANLPLIYAPEPLKRVRKFKIEVDVKMVKVDLRKVVDAEHFKELLRRIGRREGEES